MPQCTYTGPSGRRCAEPAQEGNTLCFWHDRNAPKNKDGVKVRLEQKARNRESMEGYELGQADLEDAYLMEADLSYADLTRVNLRDGHLFGINLKGARLFKANLTHANLKEAVLEGSDLLGVNLQNADLERVRWGPGNILRNHTDAEKLAADGDHQGARAKYLEAEEVYRSIRKSYEASGTADVAGDFFYWEMVTKRMQMPFFSFSRFWSWLVDILCGYGEMPYRIISSSVIYIVFNAFIFCLLGMYHDGEVYVFSADASFMENLTIFGNAVYFSVVTFTTLGYGEFTPVGWSRPFAALEAFNGAFMIALFILAFVKKMTR